MKKMFWYFKKEVGKFNTAADHLYLQYTACGNMLKVSIGLLLFHFLSLLFQMIAAKKENIVNSLGFLTELDKGVTR